MVRAPAVPLLPAGIVIGDEYCVPDSATSAPDGRLTHAMRLLWTRQQLGAWFVFMEMNARGAPDRVRPGGVRGASRVRV